MLAIVSGILRENGHKSTAAWVITGVVVVGVLAYRLYRRRRSR
jgi:cytochrome bd-type quinol oxidase subunit 1